MLMLLLAAMAVQDPAPAAHAAAPAAVIENPQWIRFPEVNVGQLARDGEAPVGEVQMNCAFTVEGRLTDCEVLSDTSRARRLGRAARRATANGRIQPRLVNGQPEAGRVTYQIRITPAS